jgi:hypothetical protein
MLACVAIAHVALCSAVKEISREEGAFPLMPSSICVADCVRDEVVLRYCFIIITYGSG